MAAEDLEALAHPHVPEATSSIDGGSGAVLSSELELSAGDFLFVADELMHGLSNPRVPDDGTLIEGASENEVSIRVEMQRNQLSLMPLKRRVDLPHLDIPQLGRAIHGPSGDKRAIGVERYGNHFSLVPSIGRQQLASDRVPDLCGLIEGARADLVAVGHVKGHAVDRVLMPLEGMDEVTGVCIPQLACSIIAASDELVSVLIEAAIGERQHVALQFLYQHELLLSLLLNLLHQF